MLIDTPEDIGVACDRQGISEIKYSSISHKDPDHTRGMRIVEPLGYDYIADKGTLIQFIALPEFIDDINAWNGDYLIEFERTNSHLPSCFKSFLNLLVKRYRLQKLYGSFVTR